LRADPDRLLDISPTAAVVAFGFDPAEEKKLDDEFDIVELDLKSGASATSRRARRIATTITALRAGRRAASPASRATCARARSRRTNHF